MEVVVSENQHNMHNDSENNNFQLDDAADAQDENDSMFTEEYVKAMNEVTCAIISL